MNASSRYRIRKAVSSDIDSLVAFTLQEAREAEERVLDIEAATRGVRCAFDDPPLATYWVAEAANGEIVASTSVGTEWSNFHGAKYWWIQSLFIAPEHRGSGLIDQLLDHVAAEAKAADALDLRLYVHSSNQRAVRAYQRRGFTVAPYMMMWREDRPDRPAQPASSADLRLHVFAGSGIVTLTNELKLISARFTPRVVRVLEYARDEAAQQGAHTVGTLHLVSAFAREGHGLLMRIFGASHVSLSTLGEEIGTVPAASRTTRASDELTPDEELLRVFQFAAEEADDLSCARIGTAHLLLGILRAEGCAAETVLYRKGMRLETTRAQVAALTADRPEAPGSKHD